MDDTRYLKYLNRWYDVGWSGGTLKIKSLLILDKHLNGVDVLDEMGTILGFTPPNGIALIGSWYTNKKGFIVKDFYTFMSDYSVELTQTDWVVVDNNGMVTKINDLAEKLANKFDMNTIRYLFNEWRGGKIIEKSEEIMNG